MSNNMHILNYMGVERWPSQGINHAFCPSFFTNQVTNMRPSWLKCKVKNVDGRSSSYLSALRFHDPKIMFNSFFFLVIRLCFSSLWMKEKRSRKKCDVKVGRIIPNAWRWNGFGNEETPSSYALSPRKRAGAGVLLVTISQDKELSLPAPGKSGCQVLDWRSGFCLCHKNPMALDRCCRLCPCLIFKRGARNRWSTFFPALLVLDSKKAMFWVSSNDPLFLLIWGSKCSLFCLKYYHSKLQGRDSSKTETNFFPF